MTPNRTTAAPLPERPPGWLERLRRALARSFWAAMLAPPNVLR